MGGEHGHIYVGQSREDSIHLGVLGQRWDAGQAMGTHAQHCDDGHNTNVFHALRSARSSGSATTTFGMIQLCPVGCSVSVEARGLFGDTHTVSWSWAPTMVQFGARSASPCFPTFPSSPLDGGWRWQNSGGPRGVTFGPFSSKIRTSGVCKGEADT